MKESIRELESSLTREREFNQSRHPVEVEYLVNILRKFLTTNQPCERSQLSGVICSLLHFKSEETRIIQEKWSSATLQSEMPVPPGVKLAEGLVSWFYPDKKASSSTTTASSSLSSQGHVPSVKTIGKKNSTTLTSVEFSDVNSYG